MLTSVLVAVAATVGAPLAMLGWLWLTERLLGRLPQRARSRVRPWLWLLFPLAAASLYLLWPVLRTVWLSFTVVSPAGGRQLGGANFRFLRDSAEVHSALGNNALWLVGLTGGSLIVGLAVALLANAVRWEAVAKSIMVMPTAISAVAGAVIWRFAYDYRPPGLPQTGTLNAVWVAVSGPTDRLARRRGHQQRRADRGRRLDVRRPRHRRAVGGDQVDTGGARGGGPAGRSRAAGSSSGTSCCRICCPPSSCSARCWPSRR